ncbi:MAG: hypothetical protein QM783_09965 [Phycisphaerales bacterium]
MLGGCAASPGPDTFASVDPAGRMHAAAVADANHDTSAVPMLVEMLSSDDPAERLVAIGVLEKLTGQRLGYSPTASSHSRKLAVERWYDWLRTNDLRPQVDPATVGGARLPR